MSNILKRSSSHCQQGNVLRSALSIHHSDLQRLARRASASENAYAKWRGQLEAAKTQVRQSTASLFDHNARCQPCADAA
jgi:hypothetical protein